MLEHAGDPVAAGLEKGLWLGTAKVDITPSRPVPLAGFAHRLGKFTGIADRLYAKIWYFRYYSGEGTYCDALLIQGDLLYWGPDSVAALIDEISGQYGMDPEAILFHGTHTHSGPETDTRRLPMGVQADPEYMAGVHSQVLAGVEDACRDMEPVVVEKGIGRSSIGINRRKKVDGKVLMLPNPDGPTDPEVTVIHFRTRTSRSKGVLIHYTCHLTTSDSTLVSAEFGGLAAEQVAGKLGADTMASFLQGCCGDIRPAMIRDGCFYRGDHSDVERLAAEFSGMVMDILSRPMETMASSGIFSLKKTVMLPLSRIPDMAELNAMTTEPGSYLDEWKKLLVQNPRLLKPYVPLPITFVQIADDLAFLGIGAEAVVHYGLFIRKMSGRRILPLGYTNGMVGYLPTAEQIAEGGYEAQEAPYYYGFPAPFDPKVQLCAEQGILAMIRQLHS